MLLLSLLFCLLRLCLAGMHAHQHVILRRCRIPAMLRVCCYCLLLGLPSLSASMLADSVSQLSLLSAGRSSLHRPKSCEQQQSMLDRRITL